VRLLRDSAEEVRAAAVEALAIASDRIPSSLRMSLAERRRRRVGQEAFWSSPSENVLDRATAMLPRLMYERLDDLGIDFSVVYPTNGLGFHRMPDHRLRRAICRAYNVFTADQFRGLGDRVRLREGCAGGCSGPGPNVSIEMFPLTRQGERQDHVAVDWKTYVYSLGTLDCLAAVIEDNLGRSTNR